MQNLGYLVYIRKTQYGANTNKIACFYIGISVASQSTIKGGMKMPIGKLKCLICGKPAENIREIDFRGLTYNIPVCHSCNTKREDVALLAAGCVIDSDLASLVETST